MTVKANDAHLIISAAQSHQFPETRQTEIVFVGKSNVGKSTIINSLVRRKKLAYVGQRPGKTRLANFYHINDELLFVDVPGYGFANRSRKEQDDYAELMDSYFAQRDIDLMLILVDIRRGLSEEDEVMINYANHYGIPYAIVLAKADKLSRSKSSQMRNNLANQIGHEVFLFSEKESKMRDEIMTLILNQIKR